MAVNAILMDSMPQDASDLQSLSAEDFLLTVGRRVRQHRSRSRMSRKRLAELSGVSERYLAQLESGQGNMSIILLRRVATAIALPLDILMSDRGPAATLAQRGPNGSTNGSDPANAGEASDSAVDSRSETAMRGSVQGSSALGSLHEPQKETAREHEFG